jgi:hypothetical protein
MLTEQLLALESEAQEAMNDIAKETAHISQRAQESLAQKINAIESDGAETIRLLTNEAETYTAAQISLVQREFAKKSAELQKNRTAQQKILRGKIFHDILYGEA